MKITKQLLSLSILLGLILVPLAALTQIDLGILGLLTV